MSKDPVRLAAEQIREELAKVAATLIKGETTDLQALHLAAVLASNVRRVGTWGRLHESLCHVDIEAGGVEEYGASLTAQILLGLSADHPTDAAQEIMKLYDRLEREAS